jgi:hypothetical protein
MISRFSRPAFAALNLILLGASLVLLSPAPARKPAGPARLNLLWVRDLTPLEPTWPDQPRFTSDVARRPVPAGATIAGDTIRPTIPSSCSSRPRWEFLQAAGNRIVPGCPTGREGRVGRCLRQ